MLHHPGLVLAVALATAVSLPAAEPIRLGLIGPYSGGSAPMGVSMRDGVRLAVKEINATGGVLGRPIELVERDDKATNDLGAQLTKELVDEKVAAILGYINTGVAKASITAAIAAKIPVIVNVSTGIIVNDYFKDAAGNPQENYAFQLCANDLIQSDLIVTELVEKRGLKKIAILNDDTGYGMSGRGFILKEMKRRGLEPTFIGTFKIGDTDMAPQLREAKASGADAFVVYGIGPENANIARGKFEIGWGALMIGSWTMSMSNFIDNAAEFGEGVMMPQTFIQNDASTPRERHFLDEYLREFKPTERRIPSAVAAAQGYDSVFVLVEAIKQAGSTEGPEIKEALEDLKATHKGVIRAYERPYSKEDHSALKKENVALGRVRFGRVSMVSPPAVPPPTD